MGESDKAPWVQTVTGVVAVNGVIAAVVGAITTAIINNASKLPWIAISAVGVGVAIGAFLVLSVVQKKLRAAVWKRPFRWVTGLRVTTRARRKVIEDRGYEKRSSELAVERAAVMQPVWRVSARDRLNGQNNLYWLENRGGEASDVRLTADPAQFMLNGEVHFPNPFGAQRNGLSEGQPFFGGPTEAGQADGVIFHVSWRDRSKDEHSVVVTLPSSEILAGTSDAIDEARDQGWKEGYKAAVDARTPDLPPPLPRWRIHVEAATWHPFSDTAVVRVVLRNSVAESVARGVRVEMLDASNSITDAGYWADMSGQSKNYFDALVDHWSVENGFFIEISWHDHESVPKHVPASVGPFPSQVKDAPF